MNGVIWNPKRLGLLLLIIGIILVGYGIQYHTQPQSISDLPACSLRILSYYNNIEVEPGQVFHQRITIGAPQCMNSSIHYYVLKIVDPDNNVVKSWKGYMNTQDYRMFNTDIKAPNKGGVYQYKIILVDNNMDTEDTKVFVVKVVSPNQPTIDIPPEILGIILAVVGLILIKKKRVI